MNHSLGKCQCHPRDSQMMGFGEAQAPSIASMLLNPGDTLKQYEDKAVKFAAYAVAALVILNHLQLHIALNQKLKKFKRS